MMTSPAICLLPTTMQSLQGLDAYAEANLLTRSTTTVLPVLVHTRSPSRLLFVIKTPLTVGSSRSGSHGYSVNSAFVCFVYIGRGSLARSYRNVTDSNSLGRPPTHLLIVRLSHRRPPLPRQTHPNSEAAVGTHTASNDPAQTITPHSQTRTAHAAAQTYIPRHIRRHERHSIHRAHKDT